MEGLEITDVKSVPCVNSRFLAPSRVTFKQNGHQRTWDYIKQHDSVSILIYNVTKKAFVLVKQFRPAPYMCINDKLNQTDNSVINQGEPSADVKITAPFEKGVTYELCAGIVDQKRPLIEIAKSEILEETGYNVPIENIKKLYQRYAVGTSGNCGTVFFTEVTDDMKVSQGGGNVSEGEFIEVFYLPLSDAKEFVFSDEYIKPAGVIATLCWFFMENKM